MRPFQVHLSRRVIITALVFAGMFGSVVIFLWIRGGPLERRIAELRAAGDPVTLADLARPPIPSEKNAATFLHRARAGATAIDKELNSPETLYDAILEGRPSNADRQAGAAVFAAHPEVISLLRQAADCESYDPQRDFTVNPTDFIAADLPRIQDHRVIARVLAARAILLSLEGQRDEALLTCVNLLRLTRHFDKNPVMVDYLVALACRGVAIETANRVLRRGNVSQSVHQAMDDELAQQDAMAGYSSALRGERAFELDSFRQNYRYSRWMILWRLDDDACDSLDAMAQMIEIGSEPRYKITDQLAQIVSPSRPAGALTRLSLPVLGAVRDARDLCQARMRCLRVLNAMQTYNAANGKSEPVLADLKLPAEATIDPFNGQPLRVKGSPQGVTVYSVGKDLKDDGGSLGDQRDVGVGPAEKKMPDSN